jgi:hypothetical protein
MQQHIGVKLINAVPMSRVQYNELRGWEVPSDENPNDEGYLVEYLDGGKANVPGYEGYVSWSPKDVFDRAYRPITGMTFDFALAAIKAGMKVARRSWNGEGMFVFLVPGSTFTVNRPPLLGIYPEGTKINYHAHIDMRTAEGRIVPWLGDQVDMLAEDWQVVN